MRPVLKTLNAGGTDLVQVQYVHNQNRNSHCQILTMMAKVQKPSV